MSMIQDSEEEMFAYLDILVSLMYLELLDIFSTQLCYKRIASHQKNGDIYQVAKFLVEITEADND